ncbi:MAG: hypothetical protein GX605_02700 [Chloroflexi bacterium]|nr:hypothetical protein [Chloroflexota bacterium]
MPPEKEQFEAIESILALDCGSVFTRAVLVDKVEGSHRLVACGEALSHAGSDSDLVSAARQAISQVEDITGRTLLSERGVPLSPERQDGSGVDAVLLTLSAAPPLRVWLAGLVEEMSLDSGRRACQSPYVVVQEVLSLVDSRRWGEIGSLAERLQSSRPDAILLVGGTDQGAERPIRQGLEALTLAALALGESDRPLLLYAGNSKLQVQVQETVVNLLPVEMVDNVRPSAHEERLGPAQAALESFYLQGGRTANRAIETLEGWAARPSQTTARALGHTVRYLAQQAGMNVLALDLGGSAATVAAQHGPAFTLSSFPGLGMAAAAAQTEGETLRRLAEWLPNEMPAADIHTALAALASHPFSMAQTGRELQVEQALAREQMTLALQQAEVAQGQDWDLILGCGGFLAHLPRPSQAALALLDAVQPHGVSILALDHTALGPALGTLATLHPLAAAQVLEQDAFLKLGTVVSVARQGRVGDLALRVKVNYANGETLSVEVHAGSLEVIPLPLNERAELELRPGRGFALGRDGKRRPAKVRADGGVLGVIVDARGRPLRLPSDTGARRQRVQEWLWALGA